MEPEHNNSTSIFNFILNKLQRLAEDDDDEEDMLDTKAEDLIIDGQVQFVGDDEDKPSGNSNQSDEFAEIISPDQIYVSSEAEFANDAEFVDSDGVKLVRIRIADVDGKEQMAWVNVVSQED